MLLIRLIKELTRNLCGIELATDRMLYLSMKKPDEKVVTNVCAILGPAKCNGNESEANDEAIIKREFNRDKKGSFHFVISTWRLVM